MSKHFDAARIREAKRLREFADSNYEDADAGEALEMTNECPTLGGPNCPHAGSEDCDFCPWRQP